jgi:DEAD/DEAH box helicase domain-containing protein
MSTVAEFVADLLHGKKTTDLIVHHEVVPRADARLTDPPHKLHPDVRSVLRESGIERLYSHQADALAHALSGRDVVVATPTASGKTLTYVLPLLHDLHSNPGAHALCIFPLKALEQDQLSIIEGYGSRFDPPITAGIYDGDTPSHRRAAMRKKPPHVVLTTPDMLHLGILASHDRWASFFAGLKSVVIDELHAYRGVFGSHLLMLMRRLCRICALRGSTPRFLASSATIANPGEHASALTDREFAVVSDSGAPRGLRHILFFNPERESLHTLSARLFRRSLNFGLKSIVFTKARRVTELISRWTVSADPTLETKISAYRAGFLPEERREIEARLFSGELQGVVSTSALEMGVDVGGLDVCILAGYPGTVVSTWQRAGRAGRCSDDSAVCLVAGRDALDQYVIAHPKRFFSTGFEPAVVDPTNVFVASGHLPCAAAETPLSTDDECLRLCDHDEAVSRLVQNGALLQSADGDTLHASRKRPHRFVNLRSAGTGYTIRDETGGSVVGTLSMTQAFTECHPGAVYLHRGRTYEVTELDTGARTVSVRATHVPYYTRCRTEKETEVLLVARSRPAGSFLLKQGDVRVTVRVVGYEKRRTADQSLLSSHELELPPLPMETVGIWLDFDPRTPDELRSRERHVMGSLHATEHAVLALFPLVALCDRRDVGGISFTAHPQAEGPVIFLYDGYPGGAGLAARAFDRIESLLSETRDHVAACSCDEGCPSCIHSPRCGSGNHPLDKRGALHLLDIALDREKLPTISTVDEEPEPEIKQEPQTDATPPRVVTFDIETRKSAEEVGGWHHADRMRVSVAVAHDSTHDEYHVFDEGRVSELVELLESADLVVGFNHLAFDYRVLSAYTPRDLRRTTNSYDLLVAVRGALGHRLKLADIAEATLGETKTGDGLQALEWWAKGDIATLTKYCRKDVEITRRLFEHARENGHLLFDREGVGRLRVPLEIDLAALAARKHKPSRF